MEENKDVEEGLQQFDGAEEEAVVLYTPLDSLSSILKRIDADLIKAIGDLSSSSQGIKLKDKMYESLLFSYIKEIPTPLEVIKYRIGGNDGREYEYFDEHYTNSELDRLFPGWWTEDMNTRYDPQTQAYITTGYLCVEYVLPSGETRIRKAYAVGGAQVYSKANEKEKGNLIASQPEDRAIASFTRWKKLAGKQYGIGLDIYHQRITPRLLSMFEDRIRSWVYPYAEPYKDLLRTQITTGKGMRKMLNLMPTVQQTIIFLNALDKVKDVATFPRDNYWKQFTDIKLQNRSQWLTNFCSAIEKMVIKLATEKKDDSFN